MRILETLSIYYNKEKLTELKKQFADSLTFFRGKAKKETANGILLVQMVKTYDFSIKLAAAAKAIADAENLYINLYAVDINWPWGERKIYQLFGLLGIGSLKKVHIPFGNKIAFKNADNYRDQELINKKLNEITLNLGNNDIEGLLALKFEDVLVGDLIYDTYLRFFHKPTIEEINDKVIYTIRVALNIYYNFKEYIQTSNVKILLNTYSSYIQHGIPARLCLQQGVKVYTLGSYSYAIQQLTLDYPYHQINHSLFDAKRKIAPEDIERAKKQLELRFGGGIDPATSYMRKSAYDGGKTSDALKGLFATQPRNIVIYAHDFFDSPHVNRKLQFPDLYQFLKQTLQALTDLSGTNVFIKLHPNGIDGNKEIAINLINGFNRPYFHILDESVSGVNIIELKPDLIATARGTIGVEMAYWGIPVAALFDNIYANFKFVDTCTTKERYFAVLKGQEKPEIDFDKEKIFSFYYQAFLEQKVPSDFNIFDIFEKYKGEFYSDAYLDYLFSSDYLDTRQHLVDYYTNAYLIVAKNAIK